MPSLAFAFAALAMGNIFGKTGWAEWFPWSIIPLLIGAVGQPVAGLPAGSYVVLAATFVAGIAATIAQVRWADNAQ
jgi:ABC-2 type transport system permease protein